MNTLLKACLPPSFKAKALAEFYTRRASDFAAFIEEVDQFTLNYDPDLSITSQWEAISDTDINGYVRFNSGSITVSSYLLAIAAELQSNDPTVSQDTVQLLDDSSMETAEMSLLDIKTELYEALESVSVIAAGFSASIFDSVSDKLNAFKVYLSKLGFHDDNLRTSSDSYVSSVLISSANPEQFGQHITNAVFPSTSNGLPRESALYQFTGASPIGPLDFNFINVLGATIGAAFQAVWSGLKGASLWIEEQFNAIGTKVHQTVVNPYDLADSNDISRPKIIDTFCYEKIGLREQYIGNLPGDPNDWMNKILNTSYFEQETIFGIIQITNIRDVSVAMAPGWTIDMTYDLKLYPKPVYPWVISMINTWISSSATRSSLASKLANLEKVYGNIYCGVDDNEVMMHQSFRAGLAATEWIFYAAFLEAQGTPWSGALQISTDKITTNQPSTVTNLDFFKVATGYNGTSFKFKEPYSGLAINQFFAGAIIFSLVYYENDPLNSEFLPYLTGNSGNLIGRYSIKSDSANKEAFELFATTVIVTAIIVVASVVIIGKLKKAAIKAQAKSGYLNFVLGEKLASGTATAADYKAYSRAKKVAQLLGFGVAGGIGLAGSMSSEEHSINDVIRLLR